MVKLKVKFANLFQAMDIVLRLFILLYLRYRRLICKQNLRKKCKSPVIEDRPENFECLAISTSKEAICYFLA